MKWIKLVILTLVLIVSVIIAYNQISYGQSGQYCSYWDDRVLCRDNPVNCICDIIIEPPK